MALPNGTFNKTENGAGAPTALPTMLIGGMKYAVLLPAISSGHLEGSRDAFVATADNVAFAQDKQVISLFNGAGSGKVIQLQKLFLVNLQLAAISTGVVALRVDCKRTTAQSGGTAITPTAQDTANAALPAQILCATNATVTESALLFPITFTNDEVGATQGFMSSLLMQATNWLPEGREINEITLRPGEGFTLKIITSVSAGSLGAILAFNVA